jgi:8-oxo-dGTP pyrophosphatase MutT (NUDIX family)
MPDLDEQRRVLVILGRGGSRWGFPGGREDGERYEDAAVREVHEETGIDCTITGRFPLRETVTVAPRPTSGRTRRGSSSTGRAPPVTSI